MIIRFCVTGLFILGIYMMGFGQSTRDVAAPKPPSPRYQSNKKVEKKGFFLLRIFKKKDLRKTGLEESEDFQKRMRRTVREKAKLERKSAKPQFQDPTYFGHKRPPKKREKGKRKFCKECGIWH